MVQLDAVLDYLLSIALSPYAVGILVAIVSVAIGQFAEGRREDVNILRGLRAEVETNRRLAGEQTSFIDSSLSLEGEFDEVNLVVKQLTTEAFQRAKTSGLLWRLPTELRDVILEHYEYVTDTNLVLNHRREILLSGSVGDGTVSSLLKMAGVDKKQITANRLDVLCLMLIYPLSPNSVVATENREVLLEYYDIDDWSDIPDYWDVKRNIEFEALIEVLEDEIDSRRIANRI